MGLYQNVGKPRFWIPITPFLYENGLLTASHKALIGLDVNNRMTLGGVAGTYDAWLNWTPYNDEGKQWIDVGEKYFIGLIRQDFAYHLGAIAGGHITVGSNSGSIDGDQFASNNGTFDKFNNSDDVAGLKPLYAGSTLREFQFGDQAGGIFIEVTTTQNRVFALSSFVVGKAYDSAHFSMAPDLQVTFARDYQNTKTTTDRGLQYSNSHYMKNPNQEAFALNINTGVGSFNYDKSYEFIQGRSDLRRWELSFSTTDEQEVFQESDSITPFTQGGTYNPNNSGLYQGAGTFDQMLHYTMGDALPFIFQPDETNFMPDQFAICRFTSPTFKMERDSFSTYKYSIGIQEEF